MKEIYKDTKKILLDRGFPPELVDIAIAISSSGRSPTPEEQSKLDELKQLVLDQMNGKEETILTSPEVVHEYRCTIPTLYPETCPVEDRQGHYVMAVGVDKAIAKMSELFPDETYFTMELWFSFVGID